MKTDRAKIRFTEFLQNRVDPAKLQHLLATSPCAQKSRFARAQKAIQGWKDYRPTPLYSLTALARHLGVASIHYKDEGERFGLGSFKALGGAYAVSLLAQQASASELTVACATDGNHGRSVAWGAQRIGARCVVFIHAGVSDERAAAIAAFGAEVRRVAGNYDDSVREAAAVAEQNGWTVVSDTSYGQYRDIPADVMAGYTVLAAEALAQAGTPAPYTHIFVQGGVGGLAAAIGGYIFQANRHWSPKLIVVESDQCACLLDSTAKGKLAPTTGRYQTVMAGLSCGEPSEIAWEFLRHSAAAFMSIDDEAAMAAMRWLASPDEPDAPIVAGESGGAGLAGLIAASNDSAAARFLGLDATSRVLLIGTEGDTDTALYEQIVGRSAQAVLRGRPDDANANRKQA